MPQIKYGYTKQVSVDDAGVINIIHRPYIPVRLQYNRKIEKTPFLCLIDSGADRNLFPAELGDILGIHIRSGRKRFHIGIGGKSLESFIHEVTLYVGTYKILTEVDFSFEHKIPILGRNTFFRHFESVSFFEKEGYLLLNY